MKRKKALVVDDDPGSRRIAEKFLNEMGFDVDTVPDGEDAVECLLNNPFIDLIVTDVVMPFMDGFEFCRAVKAAKPTCNIPIVGTSSFGSWDLARQQRDLVLDGFVQKPIAKNAFQEEVRRVLQ